MTIREALNILTTPRFGNPEQIAAVRYIEDVETARSAFGKCRHGVCVWCNGIGIVDNAPCDECDGSGKSMICRCFVGLNVDAVLEAKRSK